MYAISGARRDVRFQGIREREHFKVIMMSFTLGAFFLYVYVCPYTREIRFSFGIFKTSGPAK